MGFVLGLKAFRAVLGVIGNLAGGCLGGVRGLIEALGAGYG